MAKAMLEKGYQHGQGLGKTMKAWWTCGAFVRIKTSLGWDTKPHRQIGGGWLREKKEKRLASTRESRACYTRYSHLRHSPKLQERWIHVLTIKLL
ncbi:hypothetical protein SESBI_06899 [Sesbania bispinosa]|nr:hypothetical protein SESBI_06899 [Sesbania bispinosa]